MSESGDVLTAQSHHSSTRQPARVRASGCVCVGVRRRTHTQSRRLEVETDTDVSSDSETKKKEDGGGGWGWGGVSHRAGGGEGGREKKRCDVCVCVAGGRIHTDVCPRMRLSDHDAKQLSSFLFPDSNLSFLIYFTFSTLEKCFQRTS